MKLADVVQVVIGAGIGGGLRYVLGGWVAERWGISFPWHTFAINISGAFLLGMLMVLSLDRDIVPASMRLFLGVGILGGFTTFSTLSYESVALMQQGSTTQGLANMFGSGVAGIAAVLAGMFVGRAI